jgi:type I restriction enzyme, S subunit
MTLVAFGSLFESIRNGMNVKQSKSGDGLPITRIETIARGEIDPSRVGYAGLDEEDCKQWLLQDGDILFSHINSADQVGKCALYGGAPKKLVHGMNLLALRCDAKKATPRFVRHLLRTPEFRGRLSGFINKAVNQASISITNLSGIKVEVPDLGTQRRIAEVLDRAEALRAKRRAALALLDPLTQSIFLDLFGDPVSNSKKWPIRKLGTIGTLDRGVSKHRPRNAPELLGGPYPLIQTGDVANCGGYIRSFESTYSASGLAQSRLWPRGTLCITIAANIAKTGVLTFEACFPDSVVGFSAYEQATVEYVRVWLSFLQRSLEENAPEVAQKNINLAILRELAVPFAPVSLQQDFARRISEIEKLKSAHRASLASLDALFASLQHRAFRGEL